MQVQFTIAQARANRACVVQLAMRPRMRGNGCERRTGGTANSNRPAVRVVWRRTQLLCRRQRRRRRSIRIGREIASPRTRFVDMARTDLDTARLERVGVWRPRGLRHVSHGGTTVQTAFTTRTAPTRPCRRRVQGSAPRQRASTTWSWGSRPAWRPRPRPSRRTPDYWMAARQQRLRVSFCTARAMRTQVLLRLC